MTLTLHATDLGRLSVSHPVSATSAEVGAAPAATFAANQPADASSDSSAAEPRSSSALPALHAHSALFLDFDGTLVDLVEDPDAVVVPSGLTTTLQKLHTRLGGALAVVSGRSLQDLDRFLEPLRLPLAAEHGAQRRMAAAADAIALACPDLRDVVRSATVFAAANPGLRVESKRSAVALHYRQAPHLQAECIRFMTAAVEATANVELLHGKCVLEIKPSGISKGTAISDFMKLPAFKGRVPVFAGDDTTDESGFSVVEALGGVGIKVGAGATLASRRCAFPSDILRWLAQAESDSVLGSADSLQQQLASP
ncbi:MAG: trehalose-phosphatase [Polaromonas sp.]|nr:trehalose-phosphatase [Polaromonas sp.]